MEEMHINVLLGTYKAFPWGKVAERKRGRMRVFILSDIGISLYFC